MIAQTGRLLFQVLTAPSVGPAAQEKVVAWVLNQDPGTVDAVTFDNALDELLGARKASAVRANEEHANDELEWLERVGARVVTVADPDYPASLRERLRARAPIALTGKGDWELLSRPEAAVSFCGSRRSTAGGMQVARSCAETLVREGVSVVSGYASGIDANAHYSALAAGGTTVAVLAEGLRHFRVKRSLADVWDWDRVLVLSEFDPGARWNVGAAMQRNRTICALSNAMILVEARTTGGSYAAGRTCLDLKIPLYAASYPYYGDDAAGNRELIGRGAKELGSPTEANIAAVLESIQQPGNITRLPDPKQLELFAIQNSQSE